MTDIGAHMHTHATGFIICFQYQAKGIKDIPIGNNEDDDSDGGDDHDGYNENDIAHEDNGCDGGTFGNGRGNEDINDDNDNSDNNNNYNSNKE